MTTNNEKPLPPTRTPARAIFIGASSGGVYAMLELAAALPANFPVPVFHVQHIGAHRSQLAQLLSARGPNPAVAANDGDAPAAGTIHVAPPDHHMLLEGGVIRVTHVVPLSQMADLLLALAREEPVAPADRNLAPSPALRREHALGEGRHTMEKLKEIATPSTFSCPDCGGVLFELDDKRPVRYRCHTGHAFGLRSLAATQEQVTDAALWTGLRVLQEKEALLRRLAEVQRESDAAAAADCDREADEIAQVANAMRKLTVKTPSPASFEA